METPHFYNVVVSVLNIYFIVCQHYPIKKMGGVRNVPRSYTQDSLSTSVLSTPVSLSLTQVGELQGFDFWV